jgi:hypothetical protein
MKKASKKPKYDTKGMRLVELHGNWCAIDYLGDKPNAGLSSYQLDHRLKNGERLLIKWPDRSYTEETVIVEDHSYNTSDMGSPCKVPVSKAFIEVKYRGVKAKIRLYKSKLLCKRI